MPDSTATGPISTLYRSDLPLLDRREGKVRDIYTLPADAGHPPRILIIATDRISAFDVVMPTPIPGKGQLLTSISVDWFNWLRDCDLLTRHGVADHLLTTDAADVPRLTDNQRQSIAKRIMIGRAARVIPVECVVRGYLAGSGWNEYQQVGSVCGVTLPADLERSGKLPEPIFTPATKADVGHDENIDFDRACDIAGRDVMRRLRALSIDIYAAAAEYAAERGIILADTKFEFGYAVDARGDATDELLLVDEILTPDSSRFWPAESYEPGREQESFDKQYVRNYLLSLVEAGQWDKSPPGPELPDDIVANTRKRYEEAARRLFGSGAPPSG